MTKEKTRDWESKKLKDVVKYQKGKKPKILSDTYFENSVPYLDIHAFEKGVVRQYADIESSNLVDETSIGVVWDGARSGWVTKGQKGAIGSTIAKLSPIDIEIDFLYHFLKSNYQFINSNARGVGIPHVDPIVFWNLEIPLPPLPEQQRIVAKLDTFFAHLEQVKQRMEQIPVLLKQFRQAVLTQAVTGKLTEKWREGRKPFDFNKYLDTIEINKDFHYKSVQEKYISRGAKPPRKPDNKVLSGTTYLIEKPAEWKEVFLGALINDLTDYHANGSYEILKQYVELKEEEDYACMIRSTNFEKNDFEKLLIYISEEAYNFLEKSKLFGGEILISKIGNAGSVYIMPQLNRPASLAMNLFALRINENVNNKFIYFHLISQESERNINQYVRGVATKSIDKISVRSLKINLPSTDEQTEIVRRVEALFSKADAIEAQYKKLKEQIDQLPQAILAKAFRGEV